MKEIADQKTESPKESRRIPKWLLVLSIILAVLIIAGTGRHFYLGWKEKRLVRAAHFYLGNGNSNMLQAVLDRILKLNPNNVEAFRISGQALLKDGNSKALPWLRRAVELAPESVDDFIALAEAGLRFGQTQEALKVIRDIEEKARNRADYQDLAGRVKQSAGLLAEAQKHYEEAARLAPDNHSYRMRLAVTRLGDGDSAVREKARREIQELTPDTSVRATGLRAMIVDSVRNMQITKALAQAEELNALPDHVFSDRLMRLEILHLMKSPDFQTCLQETEREASEDREKVLPLLYWMNGNNLSLLAKDWALHLPSEVTSTVPIRLEIARSFAAFGDWKKLRFYLADEKWGDFDYMRRAFLARCYRELEASDTNSKATWAEAVNSTSGKGDALLMLARQALQWKWDTEAIDVLWQATQKSNRSGEALSALCEIYYAKRDTAGLYRAYSQLVDRNPGNSIARNNLAIFCLILDKEKDRALTMAKELHEKDPKNPAYASTYAFALYRSDKTAQALEVMKALKPEELKDPSIAAYYSAILVAAGRNDEAQEYRKLGKKASLLPEEEKILDLIPEKEIAPQPIPAAPFENLQPAAIPPASDASAQPVAPASAAPESVTQPTPVSVPVPAAETQPSPTSTEAPAQPTPAPVAQSAPESETPAVPAQPSPTPVPAETPVQSAPAPASN